MDEEKEKYLEILDEGMAEPARNGIDCAVLALLPDGDTVSRFSVAELDTKHCYALLRELVIATCATVTKWCGGSAEEGQTCMETLVKFAFECIERGGVDYLAPKGKTEGEKENG